MFDNKFFKWIFPILGSFAVNQHKLEISTIKSAKTVINSDKWLLGIFPQGGIFRNKTLENINRGFIVLAKMFKNDILPISITGVEQYNWKLFQGHIQVKIGKPISYELDEETIIDIWANQICELNGYKYLKKEEKVKISQ